MVAPRILRVRFWMLRTELKGANLLDEVCESGVDGEHWWTDDLGGQLELQRGAPTWWKCTWLLNLLGMRFTESLTLIETQMMVQDYAWKGHDWHVIFVCSMCWICCNLRKLLEIKSMKMPWRSWSVRHGHEDTTKVAGVKTEIRLCKWSRILTG